MAEKNKILKKSSWMLVRSTYFNDSVRHLGAGNDGVCTHHTIGVLLADLGDQESSHTGAGTTTKRMCNLETYKNNQNC